MNKKLLTLLSASLLLQAQAIYAADLLSTWQAAQENDYQYRSGKIEQQIGNAKREQAGALWKPQVSASAMGGWNNSNSSIQGAQFSAPGMGTVSGANFNTSINSGAVGKYDVTAMMPLYNKEKDAQKKQLNLAADIADTNLEFEHQYLMMQVTEKYFGVLLADESVKSTERLLNSLKRSQGELNRRAAIGDASQTDAQEMAAKIESTKVRLLDQQIQYQTRLLDLQDLLKSKEKIQPLKSFKVGVLIPKQSLDQIREQMMRSSPSLRMIALQGQIQAAESEKFRAESSPTLSAIAQASYQRAVGNGDYGTSSLSNSNNIVGIQLAIPLYTGGYRSAKLEESLQQAEKSKNNLEKSTLDFEKNLRQSWLALSQAESRIKTLESSNTTNQSRLQNTRAAHGTGAKTTLELLGAEIDANTSEMNLYNEKIQLILQYVRVAFWSGDLKEDNLKQINAMLR